MKTYAVKQISAVDVAAKNIPELLDKAGVEFETIGEANWADAYPYSPKVQFRMACMDNTLLLHYQVEEDSVRAVAAEDNGRVWEDACCEFFVSPVADGTYYNIECNCAGTLLIGFGPGRESRIHPTADIMQKVDRWSSLGREPFEERVGKCQWQLALAIPSTAFFMHNGVTLAGKTMRANFYKCGDKLQKCHFLSWNKIDTTKPDFHRPEFFGEIEIEEKRD